MSEARTIWHDLEAWQSRAANRQRLGVLLAAGLLIAMCATEVAFLRYFAGPDSVNMVTVAEGMPVGTQ